MTLSTLVLDSGAVTVLSKLARPGNAVLKDLRAAGQWPPQVPSAVLVECLTGRGTHDAATHRFLARTVIVEQLPIRVARRAAELRTRARRGSAVDAIVVALAEPGGVVLTTDLDDLRALAAHAEDVLIESPR